MMNLLLSILTCRSNKAICTRGQFPVVLSSRDLFNKVRQISHELGLATNLPLDPHILNEDISTPRRAYTRYPNNPPRYMDNVQMHPTVYTSWLNNTPSYMNSAQMHSTAYTRWPNSPPSYANSAQMHSTAPDYRARSTQRANAEATYDQAPEEEIEISWESIGPVIYVLHFVFASTVAVLYGIDIYYQTYEYPEPAVDPRWVFAEVVSSLSIVICFVYYGLFRMGRIWYYGYICDGLLSYVLPVFFSSSIPHGCCSFADRLSYFELSFLWLVVFGIFGKIYIAGGHTGSMNHAVWVDLLNILLWLGTAIARFVWWLRSSR